MGFGFGFDLVVVVGVVAVVVVLILDAGTFCCTGLHTRVVTSCVIRSRGTSDDNRWRI